MIVFYFSCVPRCWSHYDAWPSISVLLHWYNDFQDAINEFVTSIHFICFYFHCNANAINKTNWCIM